MAKIATKPCERPDTQETQVIVKVLLPFVQTIRQHRCRPKDVTLCKDHHVAIRIVHPDDAPVAYRVAPTGRRISHSNSEYVVRHFEGRFWWPVRHWKDDPVSRATFEGGAGRSFNDHILLSLNCAVPLKKPPEKASEYFERLMVKEVLGSTFDERRLIADRSANELAFCNGELLASAGPPLWYAFDFGSVEMVEIGPSFCLPCLMVTIRLPGPSVYARRRAAAAGEVRDIREEGVSGHLLLGTGRLEGTIEVIGPDAEPMAADLCAREFVKSLPEKFDDWGSRQIDVLRAHMPTLAEIFERESLDDYPPYRRVLEEIVRVDGSVTPFDDATVETASDILNRLAKANGSAFSEDDENALTSLASSGLLEGGE